MFAEVDMNYKGKTKQTYNQYTTHKILVVSPRTHDHKLQTIDITRP